MLEALVSSKIRRALLEHVLTHPDDRFYLRGLAKSLGLSVSPLRRELKRLEHSGILTADQEGNILFYTVNQSAPAFLQLQHMLQRTEAPLLVPSLGPERLPSLPAGTSAPAVAPAGWNSPLSHPVLISAAGAGIVLMLIVVGLFYVTMMNQRLVTQASRALTTRKAEVTVVAPQPSSSGAMHGGRWRIVPGGFGGFSSGSNQDSY